MRRRIVAIGVVLLLALVPLVLATADKKEAIGKARFIEVGKPYLFTFAGGNPVARAYTVEEEPREGWVRVSLADTSATRLVPSWINLQTVATIESLSRSP